MIITNKLEMDLTGQGAVSQIHAVQNDSNTRALEVSLLSGGEPWTVPEPVCVSMRYSKPDGTRGFYNTLPDGTQAWSVSENRITMVLAPQMLTVDGLVLGQLELMQGELVLATFQFQVNVERNIAAGVVESEDYVSMFQWVTAELDRCLAEAKESGLFDGPPGPQGPRGEAGESGENPYAYARAAGYTGSEAEFQQHFITPCLPLSGGSMRGNIAMGSRKITGLAAPSADGDAATKGYVDSFSSQIIKVWENASPASAFAGQNISLDLSGHRGIFVIYLAKTGSNGYVSSGYIPVDGVTYCASSFPSDSGVQFKRSCKANLEGPQFGNAAQNGTQDNTLMIPVKIYGVT